MDRAKGDTRKYLNSVSDPVFLQLPLPLDRELCGDEGPIDFPLGLVPGTR